MDTHNSIVSVAMTEQDKMKQLIYYSEEMSTIFSIFPVFLSTAWNKRTCFLLPYKDISNKIHFRRIGEYLFVIAYLVVVVEHVADCFQKLFLYTVEYFKLALYKIAITISCRNSSAVHSHSLKYQWLSVKKPEMS